MSDAICPKCGTPNATEATACVRCGLSVARWESYAPPEVVPHPAVDAAFEKLQTNWEDDAAHEAFIAVAQAERALDVAAARYRERARAGDEHAERAMSRIALFAAHQQANAPREHLRGLRLLYGVSMGVALFLVVTVAVFAWRFFLTHE